MKEAPRGAGCLGPNHPRLHRLGPAPGRAFPRWAAFLCIWEHLGLGVQAGSPLPIAGKCSDVEAEGTVFRKNERVLHTGQPGCCDPGLPAPAGAAPREEQSYPRGGCSEEGVSGRSAPSEGCSEEGVSGRSAPALTPDLCISLLPKARTVTATTLLSRPSQCSMRKGSRKEKGPAAPSLLSGEVIPQATKAPGLWSSESTTRQPSWVPTPWMQLWCASDVEMLLPPAWLWEQHFDPGASEKGAGNVCPAQSPPDAEVAAPAGAMG